MATRTRREVRAQSSSGAASQAIPLAQVVRRSAILAASGPQAIGMGPLRIGVQRRALDAALGPLGADADLARHARDRMSRRLLSALAQDEPRRALLGGEVPRGLLVELAPGALPEATEEAVLDQPLAEPAMIAALPVTEAADPERLAQRRAALASHGWGLALRGLTAETLGLLAPERLQADLLLLRYGAALAARGPAAALRRVDPARLVLIGCEDEESLRWGLSLGIRRFGGTHPELILAAARMAGCPARGGCTRRQCLKRAAAAEEEEREGCGNRALLAAGLLPTQRAA